MIHISSCAEVLTALGLILDILGISLLFLFAPEKFPDPQFGTFFQIEDDSRIKWENNQKRNKKIAIISVFLIIIGFVFQLLSVIFF